MLEGRSVAVVVPARDEARWIAETLRGVPRFVDRIIVVDDASTDATAALVRSVAADRPGVELVQLPDNRGVGAAIVTGYRRACAAGAEVVAVMAGDGQMDPADLAAVLLPVVRGEADYVKGNRLAHPAVAATMPLPRRVGTRVLARLTALAAGIEQLSDSQCGYTAIAAAACRRLDLDAIWPRYGYCNDLLGAVVRAQLRLFEVPVRPVYRGEASGLRPWHAGGYLFILGRMAFRRATASAGERPALTSAARRTRPSPVDGPGRPTAGRTRLAPDRWTTPVEPDGPRAARA